jgi:uncharacterized alpha-E superfamily protein
MGRLLERAEKTSRVLDVKSFLMLPSSTVMGATVEISHWGALLRSTSALEMYRRAHGRVSPQNVISFLLLDREFPRSVRYCLGMAEDSLHAITGTPDNMFNYRAEKELGRLRSEFDFTSVDDVLQVGLHGFVDDVQHRINAVGEAIYREFLCCDSPGAEQH